MPEHLVFTLNRISGLTSISVILVTLVACGGGAGGNPDDTPPLGSASAPDESGAPAATNNPGNAVDVTVSSSAVEQALATGNALLVSDSYDLEQALLDEIDESSKLHSDAIIQIFNLDSDGSSKPDGASLDAIDWNPTHDAALMSAQFGQSVPVLVSNSVASEGYTVTEQTLAAIGDSGARYMVMGSNPMRNHRRNAASLNDEMHQFLENSIAWLTRRGDLKTSSFSVVLAQLSDSYYFPDEPAVREWFEWRFSGQARFNEPAACNGQQLSTCIDLTTDLVIVSQNLQDAEDPEPIVNAISSAMDAGVPVLYLHHDGGLTALGKVLLPLFDVSYDGDNYWHKLSLSGFDITDLMHRLPPGIQSVQTMVQHFNTEDYAFDWSACAEEDCSAVTGLQTGFQDGADFVRTAMNSLDESKTDLFVTDKYRFSKLLALLGDHYRQDVVFPMDKNTTPDTQFLKSLYADHAMYQYRALNPAQTDMGNFSRSDFSSVVPASKTLSLVSKANFRSTGTYALPGQSVAVTRIDGSEVDVGVFVNTVRPGSTHQWADAGYSRPKFLQGQVMPIAAGETIRFTSPYGGPIQLSFNTNDLPVEIRFDNIGLHPYWRSSDDNASFAAGLQANEFDWAELASPSFEVHSSTDKMQESMMKPALGDSVGVAEVLASTTMRYVHNFPHVLAGFKGPGIDVIDEIHQFAGERNLAVNNLDKVKHMNADQATCGYGCSGNPYDAYWSFDPVGHGDIHELGHGLEKFRLRFNGWPVHAMTNMYSYYTKSQYFKDTGRDPNCQSLPFEATWKVLQDSLSTSDAAAYVDTHLWDEMSWSDGAAMFIQMMMSAQDNGALVNGWHLLARLHILEREFNSAINNENNWLAKRNALGFGILSLAEAKILSQNDWLLVAVSLSTGLDHRTYFDTWSHDYSSEAAALVIAMDLPNMPVNYYVSSAAGYCKGQGFDGTRLPLDGGNHAWPID